MKLIKPFRGLRPTPELAARVASHPYDVINRAEAFDLAKDNPYSFLHINKPEIDVDPSIDPHDPKVYEKGAENLRRFISDGILVRDEQERFYVYKQVMGSHEQVGLVAAASVQAYQDNLIKKHEFTRPEKEDDRVHHMDALDAQVGPVFLTYQAQAAIDALIKQVTKNPPVYDFEADDGTQHVFWVVDDDELTQSIDTAFDAVACLYVADGHHRSAAAARVQKLRQDANASHTGKESYNHFLVVLFPHDQMQVLDYNRVVKDLNGNSTDEFLQKLASNFDIEKVTSAAAAKPGEPRCFGIYLSGQWYTATANYKLEEAIDNDDPVKSLDVSILQDQILSPLLGIEDQRRDERIDFVGGIRGLAELEKRVDSGDWQLAFALYPTSMTSLMAIADAGEVMPPKSTWFEPKLKSGLVVHMLD